MNAAINHATITTNHYAVCMDQETLLMLWKARCRAERRHPGFPETRTPDTLTSAGVPSPEAVAAILAAVTNTPQTGADLIWAAGQSRAQGYAAINKLVDEDKIWVVNNAMPPRRTYVMAKAKRQRRERRYTHHVEPVTIRGVTYPSVNAAAEALGVAIRTVTWHRSAGSLDRCGLGTDSVKIACTFRGVDYPSYSAAAKANGITRQWVMEILKRGDK
jgi:hypothetical protein